MILRNRAQQETQSYHDGSSGKENRVPTHGRPRQKTYDYLKEQRSELAEVLTYHNISKNNSNNNNNKNKQRSSLLPYEDRSRPSTISQKTTNRSLSTLPSRTHQYSTSIPVSQAPDLQQVIGDILDNQRRLERELSILRIQNYIQGHHRASVCYGSTDKQDNEKQRQQQIKQPIKQPIGSAGKYRSQSVLKFLKQPERNKQLQAQLKQKDPQKPHLVTRKPGKIVLHPQNHRLAVTQSQKEQFWESFHIVYSSHLAQNQGPAQHQNKKYEQDHLVNTLELQNRLRDELLGKVHDHSNKCVYK